MKINKFLFFIGIIITMLPIMLNAQTDTLTIDLNKAIEIALSENLTLKISQTDIEAKQERIKELQGNLFPQLSASGQYMRNIKKQVIFMPEGTPFGPTLEIGSDNSYNGSLNLSLPLFSLSIYKSIDLGKINLKLSKEKYNEAKIDLIYNVKKSYYNVLLTQESYKVMQINYQNALDNYTNIQNLYNQGIVSEYDMIRAKVRVENIKPTVLQIKQANKITVNILKVFLNINTNTPIKIDNKFISNDVLYNSTISYQSDSLEDNTNIKQLNLQLQLLYTRQQLAKSSLYPSLAAFGNYKYQSQADDFNFGDYKWVPSSLVGFQLNVPIFSGFTKRRQINQIELGVKQLQLQKQYIKNNLQLQVENIQNNMAVAIEKINTTQGNIKLSEKGYYISKSRYNSGQGTLLELNDAQTALFQSKLNNIQAKFEYLLAKIEYEKIIGKNN